jgi:hypothetical protein
MHIASERNRFREMGGIVVIGKITYIDVYPTSSSLLSSKPRG